MSNYLATLHRRQAALLREIAAVQDALAEHHATEAAARSAVEWVSLAQWADERAYSHDHVRARICLFAAGDVRKDGARWRIRRLAELPLARGHQLPQQQQQPHAPKRDTA